MKVSAAAPVCLLYLYPGYPFRKLEKLSGMVLPVFPNWSQFAVLLGMTGLKNLAVFPDFWKYTGLMVKIRDDSAGEIYSDTSFSKPITQTDQKKLDKGVGIIKKVLKK
ncbi:MAG: hypothetical protein R6T90_10185, partial [Dissulfuribacterales bacterium]